MCIGIKLDENLILKITDTHLTASKASPIASSDQGVGFDLDSSIPSLLHLP